MARAIISLNAGSSSIKFALFVVEPGGLAFAGAGLLGGIGIAPHLTIHDRDGMMLFEHRWADGAALSHEDLLEDMLGRARPHLGDYSLIGVGHRIVHGGTDFSAPQLIDAAMVDALEALSPLAPLHQPHNLAGVRALRALLPEVPQIACFDTAFHHGHAAVATRFALPRHFHDEGIRRYGFHGLSYEYIARQMQVTEPSLAKGSVIAAHLGNGASLCAIRDGRSVDSSMGFTALDGLMMGTRCGCLDPGVILHLLRQGMDAAAIEHMLYAESGLLGVSGLSSDMRALENSGDPRAGEAIELFVWRVAREAAALIPALGGLDALVFTAGIGENSSHVRVAVCARLAWLGIRIDADANARDASRISTPDSAVSVHVIPTDEERMIAMHVLERLSPSAEAAS